MRETITVSMPRRLKELLDRLARDRNATRSHIVREAVQSYAERIEFERLRRAGVSAARQRGIFTDDDVFEIVS